MAYVLATTRGRVRWRRFMAVAASFAAFALGAVASGAATAQGKHNIEGTPLDTIMNTHLTPDVPEAKDFVKESRPDPGTLKYAPLSAPEPDRPKPLAPKGVQDLQAELEAAAAKNARRAGGLVKTSKPAAKAKPKAGG